MDIYVSHIITNIYKILFMELGARNVSWSLDWSRCLKLKSTSLSVLEPSVCFLHPSPGPIAGVSTVHQPEQHHNEADREDRAARMDRKTREIPQPLGLPQISFALHRVRDARVRRPHVSDGSEY